MKKYKTIRINKDYDSLIKSLVETSPIKTEKEYIEAMLVYFRETGLDPIAPTKSVSGELAKLRNTVVGFIRTQEKKKLNPIINYLDDITETLVKYLNEEAIRKSDIVELIESQRIKNINREQTDKTNQAQNCERAKELFKEFIEKMQPGINNYKIDKKTVKHFLNLFNALD